MAKSQLQLKSCWPIVKRSPKVFRNGPRRCEIVSNLVDVSRNGPEVVQKYRETFFEGSYDKSISGDLLTEDWQS